MSKRNRTSERGTPQERITMELSPREVALVTMIRYIGNGFIQKVSIRDGEPHFVDLRPIPDNMPIAQQIDLSQLQAVNEILRRLIPSESPKK